MLTGKPYDRSHFEALLPAGEKQGLRVDDSGVWPFTDFETARRLGLIPEYEVLSWKPVYAYSGDGPAPDTKNIPSLPFPFDAGDLAAFMLAGVGSFLAEFYGEWSDGPDEEALAEIDPGDSYARQALREAFDAYREAVAKVGEVGAQAEQSRGVPSMSRGTDAERTLEQAQAQAEDAHKTWLKAMVRELLNPAAQHKTAHQDVQVHAGQALLPVAAVSTSCVPAWTVTKPRRYVGYGLALHRLLAAAQRDDKPRPTARDVLEAWRSSKPDEIAQVLPNGFDYYDANGNTKPADLEALRKSIDRMTSAR